MRVEKWGRDLAIRLPVDLVEALDLREGDEVEWLLPAAYTPLTKNPPDEACRLARLRKFRGRLPADFKFNRGDANAPDL